MVRVAIVGVTGYTGEELVKILSQHKKAKITSLSAIIDKPKKMSELFPSLKGKCDVVCKKLDVAEDWSSDNEVL